MAFVDTAEAIGAVTHFLEEKIHNKTGMDITVGRPGDNQSNNTGERLNLFLYEGVFDPTLKNTPLEEGQPAPLWLVLKYILTPFDESGESDTRNAHINLGKGVRALQDLTLLQLNNTVPFSIRKALKDNPEDLKITFDEAGSDLLSKLMQGTDEKYRFSIAFHVRPILITPTQTPEYNLLVGIDYISDTIIGEEGIQLAVLATDFVILDSLGQEKFDDNEPVNIYGQNLLLPDLKAYINDKEMTINEAETTNDLMVATVTDLVAANKLSAGQWPITVGQPLPSGRTRKSNVLLGKLLPGITAAPIFTTDSDYGFITLTGKLLGGIEDVITMALYQEGTVVKVYDDLEGSTMQQSLKVTIPGIDKPTSGTYRIILRVNGQQAKQSPEVALP